MGRKKTKSKTKSKAAPKVPRITYATLKVTPNDDKAYDEAVEQARAKLGNHYPMFINGEKQAATGEEMVHACPIDTRNIVSYFPKGTSDDVKAAIAAAREAYPKWADGPIQGPHCDPTQSR